MMKEFKLIDAGGMGPEDVVVLDDGSLVTGLADGRIVRISAETVTTITNTNGRPLGIEQFADGRLLVCDARRGLLAVSLDGQVEVLVASGSHNLHVCNNAAIAADGRIFFSDSTQRYREDQARIDIGENIPTGRLLCRYPDGRVEVLLEKLLFANGVVLSADNSFVLVAETGSACINRLWLSGERKGKKEHFALNMPVLPDNLVLGSDGLFWLACVGENSAELTQLRRAPLFIRRIVSRLPERLIPAQAQLCRVIAFDNDGSIVHDISGDGAQFNMVTGVREHHGTLYLGTINHRTIARFAL